MSDLPKSKVIIEFEHLSGNVQNAVAHFIGNQDYSGILPVELRAGLHKNVTLRAGLHKDLAERYENAMTEFAVIDKISVREAIIKTGLVAPNHWEKYRDYLPQMEGSNDLEHLRETYPFVYIAGTPGAIQIHLLPPGGLRSFLKSKSEKRERILRTFRL